MIDIRPYNKDSYCIFSHSQAALLVGVHPIYPTIPQIGKPFIGGESVLIDSIIDMY